MISADQFAEVVVKEIESANSSVTSVIVRLGDVARIELGAQQYDQVCRLDGEPSVGMNIYQLP